MEDYPNYSTSHSELISFIIFIIYSIVLILQVVKWSGSNIKKFIYIITVPTISIIIFLVLAESSVMIVIHYSPQFILLASILIHLLLRNKAKNCIEEKLKS